VGGTLTRLDEQLENGASRFFSYGPDPQLYLPALDAKVFDQPVVLEIWIRLQTELTGLLAIVDKPAPVDLSDEVDNLRAQLEGANNELAEERNRVQQVLLERENDQRQFEHQRREFENERRQLEGEKITASENLAICKVQLESLSRDLLSERELYEQQRVDRELREQEKQKAASEQCTELRAQLEALQMENEQLLKETDKRQTQVYLLSDSQKEMKAIEKAYAELERKYKSLEQNFAQLDKTHRELSEEHKGLRLTFENVLASQSWRLTAPLRGAMRLVKGHPSERS
jgi:chromosome segregation ATPase